MLAISTGRLVLKALINLRNLYGCYWSREDGFKEYYLKFDGFYYDKKKKIHIVIIKIRNKRIFEPVAVKDIVNDKDYLNELHPVDTFALGLLANFERNGMVSQDNIGWQKMSRAKNYSCPIKSEPLLHIIRKFVNFDGEEIVLLRSKILEKEIEIQTSSLVKNQALLYSIGGYQAIEIGFDVSESYLRNIQ